MKTILSTSSTTTAIMATIAAFHLRFPSSTIVPSRPPLHKVLFHSPRGNVKFAKLHHKAVPKHNHQGYLHALHQNGQHATEEDDVDSRKSTPITTKPFQISTSSNIIKEYVDAIKSILDSMEDGEVTPSAYDTAWVAMVQDVNGGPQFPSSLQWVVNNQLHDGSWGEPLIFSAHDRLINTLACVITLTSWNIHLDKCQKGTKFIQENVSKLVDEKEEHITQGFEIVFPSLIELAKKLQIKVPTDFLILKEIYARRNLKLTRIPKEEMHKKPTILLFSLEGMEDLEWEKLVKLQCKDGSFFSSPSATAFAFMLTKNENCLAFLTNLVAKFNGGVPGIYPVDLFEHIWVVDRLQRLGIARYFRSEIKDCVEYIYRFWNEQGIGYGKYSNVEDIDCTAMGFRVLRMNGYRVSSDVFRQFEKDGKFICYPGQTSEAVTVMFNLFRASQFLFPEEKILHKAKKFSCKFLMEKRSTNELLDKWIIAKDLPGEVGYAIDVPWYASLPRLETRYYLDQYGGKDDVWIGKTFYRMGNINSNTYLEMAKLDYNHCQAVHQLEWNHFQEWYTGLNIEMFDESLIKRLLLSYYEATASIFESERSNARIAWAKTAMLLNTITSFFGRPGFSNDDRQAFVYEFTNTFTPLRQKSNQKPWHRLMGALHETLNQISSEAQVAHGVDIQPCLYHIWEMWLLSWQNGVDTVEGEAEVIVQTINLSSGRWLSEELLRSPQYRRLSSVTNNLCHQMSHKVHTKGFETGIINEEIESKMQELVQLVLCNSPEDLDIDLKQTFLIVVKTFYYRSYFDHKTINVHISKVLFENVI